MKAHLSGLRWRSRFADRRLRRIAPLYLATAAIYLFIVNPDVLRHGWASVVQVAMHLGYVHDLWHETHGTINPPNWSVRLESQFYLLIALCTPWLTCTPI